MPFTLWPVELGQRDMLAADLGVGQRLQRRLWAHLGARQPIGVAFLAHASDHLAFPVEQLPIVVETRQPAPLPSLDPARGGQNGRYVGDEAMFIACGRGTSWGSLANYGPGALSGRFWPCV